MKQIKYVQLEPDAFLSDVEFQTMSAEERGCYFTIILYLYRNNGKLDKSFDSAVLGNLCNCDNFETVWEKISKKFLNKKNVLSHKRVTKEIRRVRKRLQVASESGLKGAKKRWGSHSNPNGVAIAKRNETERKQKEKINTYVTSGSSFSSGDRSSVASDEAKFAVKSVELFGCAKNGDKTTLKNIAAHLAESLDDKIFDKAWRIAQECKKTGDKPIALFISRMKMDFNYRKLK
jgi:uncharacterized protein YdaU (DUF1376 family)